MPNALANGRRGRGTGAHSRLRGDGLALHRKHRLPPLCDWRRVRVTSKGFVRGSESGF